MSQFQGYQEGQYYSEDVISAVKFGYLYRKVAESNEDGSFNYCLDVASDILLWIANNILGDVTWEVIKLAVQKLYHKIAHSSIQLDKDTESILTDESQLKEFYVYIIEFYERRMSINDKQLQYIKEEIVADYVSHEAERIYEKENRFPTNQELSEITKSAILKADNMIERSANFSKT